MLFRRPDRTRPSAARLSVAVRAAVESLEERRLFAGAAPEVQPARFAVRGDELAFFADFADADAGEHHSATVNWGDGSPTELLVLDEPGTFAGIGSELGTVYGRHVYPAAGTRTVTVALLDGAGHTASQQFTALVGQADDAPAVGPTAPDAADALDDAAAPDATDGADGNALAPDVTGEPAAAASADVTPPAVQAVYVDSTAWAPAFRTYLQDNSLGSAAYGFAVPAGADQTKSLPWTNVDRVSVRFTEYVSVQAADLALYGVNTAAYAFADPLATFDYNTGTFTATWTLAAPLPADRLLIDLDGNTAGSAVTDPPGNPLDGAWSNADPAESFPSGNGTAGTDFELRLDALPGDVNRNGVTDVIDAGQVKQREGTSTTNPGATFKYGASYDVDGDGAITAFDAVTVKDRAGATLPATGTPGLPATPGGLALSGDAWADGVTFSWQDGAGEDRYLVEWSDGTEWVVIDELPAGSTSYTDEYPVVGLDNLYRVVAARGDGEGELVSEPPGHLSVRPKAPPVAWSDDNGGPTDRGTLSGYSTPHGQSMTISPLQNDRDYDASAEPYVSDFEQPGHGSLTLNLDGTLTYEPDDGFVGTDTFTYRVADGTSDGASATVAVDVTNAAPTASPNVFTPGTSFGDTYRAPLVRSVTAGDDDGDPLTYAVVDQPRYGTVEMDPDTGQFSYRPGSYSDYPGVDRFTYRVNDGFADSAPASIEIRVQGFALGNGVLFEIGSQWTDDWSVVTPPLRGTLTVTPQTYPTPVGDYTYPRESSVVYTPTDADGDGDTDEVNYDYMSVRVRRGDFESKPIRLYWEDPNWVPPPGYQGPALFTGSDFAVAPAGPTTFTGGATSIKPSWFVGSVAVGTAPAHGTLALSADGGFTFTPNAPPAGEDPFVGHDYFSLNYTHPDGVHAVHWVELLISDQPSVGRPLLDPLPFVTRPTAGEIDATLDGLGAGVALAKSMLNDLLTDLQHLGQGVEQLGGAADLDILDKLDAATAPIDSIAQQYDAYVEQLAKLNRAAGKFLAAQWFISQADYDAVADVNRLPTHVGALSASKARMEEMAESLGALGAGAGIAVDTATKTVVYAENTHKVLNAIQMAGGLGALVQTGATLLVEEGLKACAKQAAKEALQWIASGVAADLANYAADLVGIPQEYRRYIAIGVDAYQAFAFLKAARVKVNPNGACFAAGTDVIVGRRADGSYVTKNIEEIDAGDLVLSRDQSDATDDLDLRPVSRVFRRTSNHLRVLTIRDAQGDIETLRTTNEHPFWVEGRGWTGAGELAAGAVLDQPDGSDAVVVSSIYEAHPEGVAVFNFEVAQDHTYFVEAGGADAAAVWVHNTCVGDVFVARNRRGKVSRFNDPEKVTWTRVSPEQNQITRDAFDGITRNPDGTIIRDVTAGARAKWIAKIAHDEAAVGQLKQAGFTDPNITKMKNGYGDLPSGWQVHHKQPLAAGGTNDDDNLLLIRTEQHETLSWEQQLLFNNAEVGELREFMFPMFQGKIIHDAW